VLIVAAAATIWLGVYSGLLFNPAQASAATLGDGPALGLR